MQFDGMITTQSGVTAQNLADEFFLEDALGTKRFEPTNKMPNGPYGIPGGSVQILDVPNLIHGGVWEKTTEWIGIYNDLSSRLAWKFLPEDITVGSEFSYQLIPEFTDHTFLHGRVHRQFDVETEIGTFEKALDCLYILDWGISAVSDIQGQIVGYIRTFDYGRVIFAPTIGPVYSYERWTVEPGTPPTPGLADFTTSLIGTTIPAD